ncbi:MAG: putative bifunctional diguanylate cyclase/phosphodiesterase, partial [Gaiellaceae bacterium]
MSATTPDAATPMDASDDPSNEKLNEYFRALVQTLPDATMVLDGEFTLRDHTPSATRLLGREGNELRGQHLLSIVHPDDRPSAAAFLSHAINRPGTTAPTEWRVQHGDGHWIHLEVVLNNLLDDARLQCVVITGRDISPRKELERQLSHQAFHDPLTDLANRALLVDRVQHAFQRQRNPFALLFLDLDNFKLVNDSLGHAAGDELLKGVAARLRTCLRPTDTAARLGGDEFALLLEETRTPDEAIEVAERVLRAMGEPFHLGDRESFTQTSIGIAMSTLVDATDELIRNADIAMYQAKQRGKGTYVVFEPSMHEEALERSELESDLRGALVRDQLLLHYQPIIELASGRIVGLEALLRWNHPERGLLAPNRFIEIAEETGLIKPIGEWVLHQASGQLGTWQREFAHNGPLSMAVNLSGRQLESDSILDQVRDASANAGIAPSSLLLEITETVMVKDSERSAEMLTELRRLGSRVAVDDFGMGYSSLHYLHSFPIDLLKVAKPFVDGVARDE